MACGKGTCKVDLNRTVPFVCECDAGWKQFQIDDSFRFMPCVIPNCNIFFYLSLSLSRLLLTILDVFLTVRKDIDDGAFTVRAFWAFQKKKSVAV